MQRPPPHKIALLLGHATFFALIVLSWKHFELRTTSGDTAYQIFKWVNTSGLNIEAHRYSAIFPQLAVKACKFFHADLKTLLFVASVAHVLVAYAVFLLCLHVLRAPRSAMAAALAAVLCTRLTFYGPVLEANYLLSYPFLFFAVVEGAGMELGGWRNAGCLIFAGALTLLVHPLGWLILLFGVVYLWSIRHIASKTAILTSGMLVCGAIVVRLLFPSTAYEQAQYENLSSAFFGQGMVGSWSSWKFLVGHTFYYTTNYLPALAVVIFVVFGLLLRKHRLAAAVLAGGVISFLAMELVTFRAGDSAIMMDRAFLPVATLISLPAMYLLWELQGRWAVIGTGLLVLVLFIKLRDISFGSRAPHEQFERTTQLLQAVQSKGEAKAEITEDELSQRGIEANWSLPFGTLLVSAMDGPKDAITVRVRIMEQIPRSDMEQTGPAPRLDLDYTGLNSQYFQLPEGPYMIFPVVDYSK